MVVLSSSFVSYGSIQFGPLPTNFFSIFLFSFDLTYHPTDRPIRSMRFKLSPHYIHIQLQPLSPCRQHPPHPPHPRLVASHPLRRLLLPPPPLAHPLPLLPLVYRPPKPNKRRAKRLSHTIRDFGHKYRRWRIRSMSWTPTVMSISQNTAQRNREETERPSLQASTKGRENKCPTIGALLNSNTSTLPFLSSLSFFISFFKDSSFAP